VIGVWASWLSGGYGLREHVSGFENFSCRSTMVIFKGTVSRDTDTIAGALHGFCMAFAL
jgi:hypothetical protein